MPHLDFMTLYILIFLNSLTVAAIWAGFAYTYRPHAAAQHWLVATLLTLIGGIVLAVQGNEGSVVPAILGNTIIILDWPPPLAQHARRPGHGGCIHAARRGGDDRAS
jgi:hypothetical protein